MFPREELIPSAPWRLRNGCHFRELSFEQRARSTPWGYKWIETGLVKADIVENGVVEIFLANPARPAFHEMRRSNRRQLTIGGEQELLIRKMRTRNYDVLEHAWSNTLEMESDPAPGANRRTRRKESCGANREVPTRRWKGPTNKIA